MRSAGRLKRYGAIAACLVMAYMAYPKFEPVVVEQWWPEMVATYKGKIEPLIDNTVKDLKAWLSKMEKRGEASLNQHKRELRAGRKP